MAKKQEVGIDLVEVTRFKPMTKNAAHPFLQKVFTKEEVLYCYQFTERATHLAGTFAAKEAVSKALGVEKYPFAEVEIRRDKEGKPHAWYKKKKLPVTISITHTATLAAAVALATTSR